MIAAELNMSSILQVDEVQRDLEEIFDRVEAAEQQAGILGCIDYIDVMHPHTPVPSTSL